MMKKICLSIIWLKNPTLPRIPPGGPARLAFAELHALCPYSFAILTSMSTCCTSWMSICYTFRTKEDPILWYYLAKMGTKPKSCVCVCV